MVLSFTEAKSTARRKSSSIPRAYQRGQTRSKNNWLRTAKNLAELSRIRFAGERAELPAAIGAYR